MLRIVINGILGKMGQVLCSKILQEQDFILIGGVDTLEAYYADEIIVTTSPTELLEDADIVIDFSSGAGASAIAHACLQQGTPLITGTTSLHSDHQVSIGKLSQMAPVLQTSNFSIGMNLLFSLLEDAVEKLSGTFDAEIIDIGSRRVKESPAASAVQLSNIISGHLRSSKEKSSPEDHLPKIHSLRGGNSCAEEQVHLFYGCESISISHKTLSYAAYVHGAMAALRWLPKQQPGLYSMQDLLSDNLEFNSI